MKQRSYKTENDIMTESDRDLMQQMAKILEQLGEVFYNIDTANLQSAIHRHEEAHWYVEYI